MAATLKTVTPNLNKGNDYLPGPGTGGQIPGQSIPGPQPTAAQNSGKKLGGDFSGGVQIFPNGTK